MSSTRDISDSTTNQRLTTSGPKGMSIPFGDERAALKKPNPWIAVATFSLVSVLFPVGQAAHAQDAQSQPFVAPVVFQAAGPTPESILSTVNAFRAVPVGLALGRELMERYPANFRPAAIQNLLVNRSTMWSILRGDPFARILAWADSARNAFLQRRASYLLYK